MLNQKVFLKFQPRFKPEGLYRTNLISLWQFISSYEEKDHVLSGNFFPPVNVSNSLPLPSDDKILNSLSLKPMCFSFKSCSKSRKTGEQRYHTPAPPKYAERMISLAQIVSSPSYRDVVSIQPHTDFILVLWILIHSK